MSLDDPFACTDKAAWQRWTSSVGEAWRAEAFEQDDERRAINLRIMDRLNFAQHDRVTGSVAGWYASARRIACRDDFKPSA